MPLVIDHFDGMPHRGQKNFGAQRYSFDGTGEINNDGFIFNSGISPGEHGVGSFLVGFAS